ncbi:catalase related subgroup [Hyphomicrobium denitrificans 1NES1]|uniref:Catalase-related peroxidase n=1 Tax=Hyphomicrobium denitrificans 1NES1 TaxID=670307 RepID=N0B193_9HYPH|nr:catalase family peroxidase [Hyphomicrobium denitrificans]AGK56718.1 catalase related subgroup [Hyphomicrobium denitrificans 1NES1]
MKEAAIPVLIATAISLLAITTNAEEATPDAVIDALNGVFGVHQGARAVHAKGTVLTGTFTASPEAAALSTAPHLQTGASVPVTVRFSNFAGIPTIADNDGLASPRGMAVKFKLADGSETDIVAHSFNGFPVATTNEFRQLLVALGTSKPDTPKPTPLDKFLGDHPIAKAFLTAAKPNPVSYASLPYYGVNAFKFTNKDGKATFVRYQIVPFGGEHYLSEADAKTATASYLSDEIKKRVGQGPVTFNLVAQIADAGDKVDDPSIAWPADRKTVSLGTISLTASAGDDAANPQLVFMPNAVPAGIEAADPMVADRAATYAVSFARRHP